MYRVPGQEAKGTWFGQKYQVSRPKPQGYHFELLATTLVKKYYQHPQDVPGELYLIRQR